MLDNIKQYYYGNERSEMLDLVPLHTTRLLDVGCGNGVFAAKFKAMRRAEAWGIEIVPEAANEAATKLDRVINSDALSAFEQLPKAHFDCIVFNDVLEHMVDPYTVVDKAKELLTPNGIVVASIPNVRYLPVMADLVFKGKWDYQDWGVLDRTHLRFFTESSIKKLFNQRGYRIDRLFGINPIKKGALLFGMMPRLFRNTRYIQFACVASPTGSAQP
jgi:2-polyprenyl-3-methyl-5-hydroxy-6-metoxy-1,4-benzoquinol methylase